MDKSKVYPRTGDMQTVYLKSVISCPTIEVGDSTATRKLLTKMKKSNET